MRIDGKRIAEEIRKQLKTEILKLKTRGITPKVAIITLGPEGAWETYVRQKIKVAGELGIIADFINLADASEEKLIRTVHEIDSDPSYHGIIVQRPIPLSFNRERVVNSISPEKDIDGFRTDSKFEVPVWLAVRRILTEALPSYQFSVVGYQKSVNQSSVDRLEQTNRKLVDRNPKTENRKQKTELNFVVIGKGETAGGPVIRGLEKMGIKPSVIDSKTQNPDSILKKAGVIISCIGKSRAVRADNIKKGVALIGVGTHVEDGKLRGDYDASEIEEITRSYTPTPGGVGPVNLAYLFSNLTEAARRQAKN